MKIAVHTILFFFRFFLRAHTYANERLELRSGRKKRAGLTQAQELIEILLSGSGRVDGRVVVDVVERFGTSGRPHDGRLPLVELLLLFGPAPFLVVVVVLPVRAAAAFLVATMFRLGPRRSIVLADWLSRNGRTCSVARRTSGVVVIRHLFQS